MPLRATPNLSAYRRELRNKLMQIPEENNWKTVALFAEMHSLLLFAYAVYIQQNADTGAVRAQKWSWSPQHIKFDVGLYFQEEIQFSKGSITLTPQETEQLQQLLAQTTNPPNKPDGVLLDGSEYTLSMYRHEVQVTHLFHWENQLEGNIRNWYTYLSHLIDPVPE